MWRGTSYLCSCFLPPALSQLFFSDSRCKPPRWAHATWLFIRSGGSVVVSILLHYSVNFSLELLGLPIPALALVLVVFAVLVLALDRSVGWFQQPRATSLHSISP